MPKFLFICGPHCSGKTSMLKTLYERGVITERGFEIGKDLFYERSINTATQGLDFELEISNLELDRDISFISQDGIVGVETWHPGNMAYAAIRNPEGIEQLIQLVKKSPFINDALGIWLRIPKDEIINRTKTFKDDKEWAGEFYEKIDNNIEVYLKKLGLMPRTTIIDANKPFNEVVEEVSKIILNYDSLN